MFIDRLIVTLDFTGWGRSNSMQDQNTKPLTTKDAAPPKVWIGRVGGELYPFTMAEIKAGKVWVDGILPELYQSKWPALTSGVDVTRVVRKHDEHNTALRILDADFPLLLPEMLNTADVREDSKEEQTNSADIARGKMDVSFVGPFRAKYNSLDAAGRRKFVKPMLERLGVKDERLIVVMSDDRSQIMSDALKLPVYGHLVNHSNLQVREVLEPDHDTPGERVKETDGANYGVINSLWRRQTALEALRDKGLPIDEAVRLETTLCIAPLIPGLLPLPDEGIIIRAEGESFKFRHLIEEDLAEVRDGNIFDYDRINFLPFQGLSGGHPDGIIMSKLKKHHPNHPFFVDAFSPGVAMAAFAEIAGLPKKTMTASLRRYWNGMGKPSHVPKTVVSSASMMSAAPTIHEIECSLDLPSEMKLSRARGSFKTLRDLETLIHSGQAFVVQDPNKFSVPTHHGLTDQNGQLLSEDYVRLERELSTNLLFPYLITMSTQSGSPNHFGRAHMVEKSYFERFGKWHPDFCNLGLTGDVEAEAYRVFDTKDQLVQGLESWSRDFYKHNVPTPANDFIRSEEELLKILGLPKDDKTMRVGLYGSATSFIDEAYTDAEGIAFEASKRGFTTLHGGGGRSAMLGFWKGFARAVGQGYKALTIGIRSADVSPLEGNIVKLAAELGDVLTPGADSRHLTFMNGRAHVLELNRLLQRQHPIAAASDITAFVPGGKGTVVEFAITVLHNARVRIFGEGLFPGFRSNNKIIPILMSDHEFDYLGKNRKIFDLLLGPYKGREEFLGIEVFSGPDRIQKIGARLEAFALQNGFNVRSAPQAALPAPVSEPA